MFLNGSVALVLGEIVVQRWKLLCEFGEVERDFPSGIEDPGIECTSGFNSCFVGA